MPPLTLSGTDGIDVGATNVIDENGNVFAVNVDASGELRINGTTVVDSSGNIDASGEIRVNGNVLSDGNSIKIPTGTTGERPASPATGELRFNTDLNLLEQYDGTEWGSVGGGDVDADSLSIGGTEVIDNSRKLSEFRVNTQTISSNTNASTGVFYVATADLTLTLPASPTVGDIIGFQNSSDTVTCVIARNGENILSLAEDLTVDSLNTSINLQYAGSTTGWVFA
jgi:cytoskeletal protein CcmA (bactofilin family)